MRLADFFYLQKSDRQVLLALLLVIGVGAAVVFFAGGAETSSALQTGDSLQVVSGDTTRMRTRTPIYYKVEERRVERFPFDPNTADSTQLLRLGLLPWQVRNIYKYRAAGGIYRVKEDFARLYGLTVKQYRELEPYIRISSDYAPASTLVEPRDVPRDTLCYPQKLREGETIDLAVADTADLRRVPGIGVYFARRILQYGSLLGGYVSTDQLDEIEGFPSEAKSFITLSSADVTRMAINKLSLNELKRHPYINYYQARAIVDYRRQHGPITDLHALALLPDFPEDAIRRLLPYIDYSH